MGELLVAAAKIAAVVAVGLPILLYLAQDGMIFYRQPLPEARRAEVARRFPAVQEIALQAADGTRLHAWHVRATGRAPLVLYFGGNAEEVSWMIEEALARAPGMGWLLVDYRGYGASGGAPSEATLTSDAQLWYDHAAQLPEVDATKIFAFGRSLGSGVAVQLAAKRPLAGVILVAPFDSLAAVAKRYYWYMPVDLLLKHRFDSLALAPGLRTPLLCLVAERDEIIPPEHAERLYAAWAGPKRWVPLAGATHNDFDGAPPFWSSIGAFLAGR